MRRISTCGALPKCPSRCPGCILICTATQPNPPHHVSLLLLKIPFYRFFHNLTVKVIHHSSEVPNKLHCIQMSKSWYYVNYDLILEILNHPSKVQFCCWWRLPASATWQKKFRKRQHSFKISIVWCNSISKTFQIFFFCIYIHPAELASSSLDECSLLWLFVTMLWQPQNWTQVL